MARLKAALLSVVVFAAGLLVCGYKLGSHGIASGDIDPLAKIGTQDEALYSSVAIRAVERGDWLTPKFLGGMRWSSLPC